jgi:hypothetical protein
MLKKICITGLLLSGVSGMAVASSSPEDYKAEKVLRAVYDIERAYLRYHAKSDPLSMIPSVVSPLFPQFGFEPKEPSLKWKVIKGATDEEVKLCYVYIADDSLSGIKVKAGMLERDYSVDQGCLSVVGVKEGLALSKTIKRAAIATKNKLPKDISFLGLTLYADKPALSFTAKTGKWSAPQTFLVYKEKPYYDFRYNPLLSGVVASDQFDAQTTCYSSFFEDWCYVYVYYYADRDSPSKLGTITLNFTNGTKGLISVKGDQKVSAPPSNKYLRRARGW